MTNGCVTKSVATPNDLKKIHNYTRREVTAEELYVFDAINYLLLIAACAAASLAIGTRNGEHDT